MARDEMNECAYYWSGDPGTQVEERTDLVRLAAVSPDSYRGCRPLCESSVNAVDGRRCFRSGGGGASCGGVKLKCCEQDASKRQCLLKRCCSRRCGSH